MNFDIGAMWANFNILQTYRVSDCLGSRAADCRRRVLAADKHRRHEESHFIDQIGFEKQRCQDGPPSTRTL